MKNSIHESSGFVVTNAEIFYMLVVPRGHVVYLYISMGK